MLETLLSDDFMIRAHCGAWAPGWPLLYQVANGTIFISYVLIAFFLVLGVFQRHLRNQTGASLQATGAQWMQARRSRIAIIYALFILLCGIGHLVDGVGSFHSARYHLWTLWHCVTAAVSAYAAVITFRIRIVAAKLWEID